MKKEDITIVYSGRKDGRHENGVGFIVSDDILSQVKDFTAPPTDETEENLKNEFYDDLENILDTTTNSCIKILMGDFNAKIGKEDMYRPTIGPNSLHDAYIIICNDVHKKWKKVKKVKNKESVKYCIEKLLDRDVLKEYILCKTQQQLQKTATKIQRKAKILNGYGTESEQ
ncbi:uncharacterized protein LOC103309033 [Acyrthosiphon pisum]|uniref:Craniofacial development protein 2-like n=1 Tax=Acyrthosiphon pisum TaxID=7029 RepID=A0A8R2F8V4_ACYPI|nr:uncharacterized protein LOC103309033 [Acyrthosiphon pisum]|eukprot:XP_008181757.1 PREDICTED: uncharacterized protein LOC103309033 [Acyrthosiphon pisum]